MNDSELRQSSRPKEATPARADDRPADNHMTELVVEMSVILEEGDDEQLHAFLLGHAREAHLLRQMLPAMRSLASVDRRDGKSVSRSLIPELPDLRQAGDRRMLGDFCILSEIGRGGMGVVYLAEQVSLQRHVALKTLPLAAMIDARQLQRFKNEVRAVAALDHPNIVSIYSVGEERGVHYYAMQKIDGQSLSQIVKDLRRLRDGEAGQASGAIGDATQVLLSEGPSIVDSTSDSRPRFSSQDVDSRGIETTVGSSKADAEFFRVVARLGIQAARAIDYAHQRGIVHRDIKPGNLLIDSNATLFVTDFGLAQIGSDADLSLTGEMLGTLRYMSPEQARGERQTVNHRTDVYSLGATLYELATLVPAFPSKNRQETLEQVTRCQPVSMRSINGRIPVDLETIVMKAMAKEPNERYTTAEDLAADLDCFLKNRPIKAKRPSMAEVAVKWMTRNQVAVAATIAGLMLLSVTLAAGIVNAVLHQKRADENFRKAQSLLFAADVRLAGDALENSNSKQASQRLQRHVPDPGQPDPRGFAWRYLWQQINREASILPAIDDGDVCCLQYSPEGDILVSGHDYGRLYIWSSVDGERLDQLVAHKDTVGSLSISSDSRWLLTGDDSGDVLLWDLAERRLMRSVMRSPESVRSICFAPDRDAFAVAASEDVFVYQIEGDELIASFERSVGEVRGLAIFGQMIAIASHAECVYLWDYESDEHRPLKLDSPALSVAFSRDGRQLAVGTQSGEIRVFDVQTGVVVHQWAQHAGNVYSVEFTSDGSGVLSAGKDTTVRVWDLHEERDASVYQGHGRRVFCAHVSPDGKFIASGGRDGNIRLWQKNKRNRFTQLQLTPPAATSDAEFSNDGRVMAVTAFHRTYFVETRDGAVDALPMYQSSWKSCWSPDNSKLVTIGHSRSNNHSSPPSLSDGNGGRIAAFGSARRIVGERDEPALSDGSPHIINDDSGDKIVVDWNHDGTREELISGARTGTIAIQELDDVNSFPPSRVIASELEHPLSAGVGRFNDDQQTDLVVATFSDNTIAWYAGVGFAEIGQRHVLSNTVDEACSVVATDLDDDGRTDVLAAGRTGMVCWFRNVDDGEFSAQLKIGQASNEPMALDVFDVDGDGRSDVVVAGKTQVVWFRRQGPREFESTSRVISTLDRVPCLRPLGHNVLVWDAKSREVVDSFHSRTPGVNCVAISSDHRVVIGSSQELRIFNADGSVEKYVPGFPARINDLQFSRDEQTLAIAAGDFVFLWDMESQTMLGECIGHESTVERVRFAPDGVRLASISHDQSVCVWNRSNQQVLAVLLGHKHQPTAVCFSADGDRLATADMAGTVIIWDLITGQKLLELKDAVDAKLKIHDLRFASGSKLQAIGSSSDRGTFLCTWDADP